MTAPGICVAATAVATRGAKSTAMAAVGAVVGFGLWMGTTVALMPFLFFMALGAGAFVAALVGAMCCYAVLLGRAVHPSGRNDAKRPSGWVLSFF